RDAVRRAGRRSGRLRLERRLVRGRVLAPALCAALLSAAAPRTGRVELPGRLQDLALHDPDRRDANDHARHGAYAAARLLFAAQRRVLRGLLLRVARST